MRSGVKPDDGVAVGLPRRVGPRERRAGDTNVVIDVKHRGGGDVADVESILYGRGGVRVVPHLRVRRAEVVGAVGTVALGDGDLLGPLHANLGDVVGARRVVSDGPDEHVPAPEGVEDDGELVVVGGDRIAREVELHRGCARGVAARRVAHVALSGEAAVGSTIGAEERRHAKMSPIASAARTALRRARPGRWGGIATDEPSSDALSPNRASGPDGEFAASALDPTATPRSCACRRIVRAVLGDVARGRASRV